MDSLASDKKSTQKSGARKMIDVLKRLPNGWSMIETKNGFAIHDDDDEFVCEAESSSELNRMLLNEFELAQMFASMMYVLKTSEPAEA
jgi:hypothetical protein